MTERACKAEEGRSVSSIRWISAATSQVDRPAAAVFVHGLGTSDLDLLPVAHAFAEQGIEGILLTLSGHDQSADDMPSATVAGWLDQVRGAVDTALELHQTTYLVGFSLGAALVLRVAAERDVAGVLCVSAFARPTKPMLLARAAVSMGQFPPVGSRRPRVSAKRTRADLRWAPKLPASIVASVLSEAPSLTVVPNDRRVLFIHSVDDPVADYAAVAELVQTTPSDRVRLISLSGLAHFIQFDIPTQALCRLTLAHFHPATQEPDRSHLIWVENVKQREEEVLRWSNVLTLLFFAVFTVFGTLAKATLPEVISKQRGAPYLLFAYALLIAGYLQIVFLYFFYMNRTQVYLRIYADPVQQGGVGWTFYRTSRWVSGRASRRMTRLVASSGTLLPLLVAMFSATYALVIYHTRLLHLTSGNVVLQLLALLSLFWLAQTIYTGIVLVRYTNVQLYLVPPVVPASQEFLTALQHLYASIRPGVVRQDPDDNPTRTQGGGAGDHRIRRASGHQTG